MSYCLPFPSGAAPHSYELSALELQFQLRYEVSVNENTTQLQQRESIIPVGYGKRGLHNEAYLDLRKRFAFTTSL